MGAEDGKPDKTPEQGQLSQQQLDAIVLKVAEALGPILDKRFSGFQGVLDKKVKELREDMESPDTDVVSDPKPGSPARGDRATRRAAAELHDREVALARGQIALEFGLKPEDVGGDTPDQMRIDVLTKIVRAKATTPDPAVVKAETKKDDTVVEKPLGAFTPLASGGNPVVSSAATSAEAMIGEGLKAIFKTVK